MSQTNKDIQIVKGGNFGDELYWDYRIWFTYKDEPYTYVDIGSFSGCILCSRHLGKGFLTMLNGHDANAEEEYISPEPIRSDSCVVTKIIPKLISSLIESGEDTLDIYEDDYDYIW